MSRRHHYFSQTYDYNSSRYAEDRPRTSTTTGIEYQDDSLDSINSEEDSYLNHPHLTKNKSKTNVYNMQKTSSANKPNKIEKPTTSESYHPKDPPKSSHNHHSRRSASKEAKDSTSERLGRLEAMLEQLVKRRNTPENSSEEVKSIEKRDPFVLEPRRHDFTISMWINRIQERSIQSNWEEKTTIMFMANQMSGIIKAWYNSLPNHNYTWPEWKLLITKVFPDNTDFVTTLKRLVTRLKQNDETMSNYYFSKMYLIEACKITGEDAVSCLIDGLNNHTIQEEAKSQCYLTPETLFSQFLTMLPEYTVDYTPEVVPEPAPDQWYYEEQAHPSEEQKPPMEAYPTNEEFMYHGNNATEFIVNDDVHPGSDKKRPAPVHSRLDKRYIRNNLKVIHKQSMPSMVCSHCGKRGHLARNCRLLQKMLRFHLNNVEHNRCLYKSCSINGIKLSAFIDTGSTSVTIRKEDARFLGLNFVKIFDEIEVFGGGRLSVLGQADVVLEVDGVAAKVKAVIVENRVQDVSVIIGQEFLNRKNIALYMLNDTLSVYEEPQC